MGFSTTLDRKPTTYKVVLLSWVSLAVGLISVSLPYGIMPWGFLWPDVWGRESKHAHRVREK